MLLHYFYQKMAIVLILENNTKIRQIIFLPIFFFKFNNLSK